MRTMRLGPVIAAAFLVACGAPAPAASLPVAPSSRLIFDVEFASDCGSSMGCDGDEGQLTAAGQGKWLEVKPFLGWTPGYSRDGRRVAYVDDHDRLIVADVGSNRRHRSALHAAISVANAEGAPSWSPDGSRIAFVHFVSRGAATTSFITTIGADGRGLRRLTEGTEPAWSPVGDTIAFKRFTQGTETLYMVSAHGGHERLLGPGAHPDWSPAGDALVFDGRRGILIAHPDGTHARRLAAAGYEPRFSPDGRRIAFIDRGNACVMDRDGSHRQKVLDTDDLVVDFAPEWDSAYVEWLGWQPLR